jgi:hypothetical protein
MKFDKNSLDSLRPVCSSEEYQPEDPPRNPWVENRRHKNRLSRAHYRARSKIERQRAIRARRAVRKAVDRGDLQRLECEIRGPGCLRWPTEAHHESYDPDKWLDVVWVCKKCHAPLTAQQRWEKV